MGELTRGFGVGANVKHLKRLDYLEDKARAKAKAESVLNEFERWMNQFTMELNIIRPAMMLGAMGRVDFNIHKW